MSDEDEAVKEEKSSKSTEVGSMVFCAFLMLIAGIVTFVFNTSLQKTYFDVEIDQIVSYIGQTDAVNLFKDAEFLVVYVTSWVLDNIYNVLLGWITEGSGKRILPFLSIQDFPQEYIVITSWMTRRFILSMFVLCATVLLVFTIIPQARVFKMKKDIMKMGHEWTFTFANRILINGSAFLFLSALACLPIHMTLKIILIIVSLLPLPKVMHSSGRIEYLVPTVFVLSNLFLGPYALIIGSFMMVYGLFFMLKEWPSQGQT